MGEYYTMFKEIHEEDHHSFYEYFQMTPERLGHVLSLVGPVLLTEIVVQFRASTIP